MKQPPDAWHPRILILILNFHDEKSLMDEIERIPKHILAYEYQILIIDDSVTETLFLAGLNCKKQHPDYRIEILYHPAPLGYGGKQKIGYQYAITHLFDIVILLHGQGKYTPEIMEDMLRPVLNGEAHAVIGSRFMPGCTPLEDGMPFYKYIGNRLLTALQNRLIGCRLSELHSGYRVYSLAALRQIPFQYNTDDYHFDTEILIQCHAKGFKVREVAIPTYQDTTLDHGRGLAYAFKVMQTTFEHYFFRMGILYRRCFDVIHTNDIYTLKLGYPSSHTMALALIKSPSKVLDIGCGPGRLAREIRKKGCFVCGVDRENTKIADAFDHFIQRDLNQDKIDIPLDDYDYVLLLDILEHLIHPEGILDALRAKTCQDPPQFILTVPNTAFFIIRLRLLLGSFLYGKKGILDLTHVRLFTEKSIVHLLEECGYSVKMIRGIPAPFPKAFGDNLMARFFLSVNTLFIRLLRRVFAYQILIVAEPKPTIDCLIRISEQIAEDTAPIPDCND